MPVPANDRGGEGFLTHAAEAELRAEVERLREALRDVDRWVRADAPKSLILAGIKDRIDGE